MKKYLAFILAALMLMSACGSSSSSASASDPAPAESKTEQKRDLPEGNYTELGEGTVYIATPGGTSEDGNVPVIYAEKGTIMMEIGLEAWDFNGSNLSYIYVDGMLLDKQQLADTQSYLTLEADQLTVGTHTVEIVQYANDDPASDMITYRIMSYEVKAP